MNNELIGDIKDMRKALCDIEEMARNSTTFPENLDDYYKIRGIAGSAWQWSVIALGDDNELDMALTQQQESHAVECTAVGIYESYYKCSCGKTFRVDTENNGGSVDCPAQQQEAEPVACEVVGRAYHESFGNGVRLKLYIDAHQWPITEAIPIGTKLYFNPPKPAAQPQVPDGFVDRLELQIAYRLEDQLCTGKIDADGFVVENRKLLRELIEKSLSAAKEQGK